MTEQEVMSDEENRITQGAPPRDMSDYTEWRDDTDPCVLSDLNFYGTYLAGQTNGMSTSLPLPSVVAGGPLRYPSSR